MLQDIYNSYLRSAKCLGNFQALTKTQLANGYCDADEAGNESLKNSYFSALMLRYWYKIFDFSKKSPNIGLELEDFSSWLSEALLMALSAKKWRDPSNKLYTDPDGPDKVINMWCNTIRLRKYYLLNLDNNRINFCCDSIERQIETYGDSAEVLQRCETTDYSNIDTHDLIKKLFKDNRYIEAFIIDNIVYQDPFKTTKNSTTYFDETLNKNKKFSYETKTFSKHELVELLLHINNEIDYYVNTYNINEDLFNKVYSTLKELPKYKLNKVVNKALVNLQNTEEIKNLLCI